MFLETPFFLGNSASVNPFLLFLFYISFLNDTCSHTTIPLKTVRKVV